MSGLPAHTLLLLSLIALLVGPTLFWIANFNDNFLKALDGFVLVAICGLVFAHILPHTVADAGWIAVPVIFAGLLLPTFFERAEHRFAETTHSLTMTIALIGILLHTFTDGMALVDTGSRLGAPGGVLPTAILLHRVPDSLTLWWLTRPIYGRNAALRIMILMAAATVVGFFFGEALFSHLSERGIGIFEAVVGGSLLHVIFHHEHPMRKMSPAKGWEYAAGAGALLAAGFVFAINSSLGESKTPTMLSGFGATFSLLARESATALVIAYVFAGCVQTFLPHAKTDWLKRGNTVTQALKGMVFGLPLPVCSCGVVPIYRSLIVSGVPIAAAIAFFVATPEFSFDAFLLSAPLLGWEFTLIRLVAAGTVALSVGVLIGKLAPQTKELESAAKTVTTKPLPDSLFGKLAHAFKLGFFDSFEDTGPWIVVGIAIAAVMAPVLDTGPLAALGLPSWMEVPLFALIGMPVYVCASGATPLVAIMLRHGVSPGAGLAFLLTGPATNATTFAIVSRVNGRRTAIMFALLMALLSITAGLVTNLVFDASRLPALVTAESPEGMVLQTLCLAFLSAIFVVNLLRRGPRFLINRIISFDTGEAKQGHHHHHHHGVHDHSHATDTSCCPHEKKAENR